MTTIILEALKNSILITGLVMIMMMLIEYVNIHTHGKSFKNLKSSSIKQILLAASLGIIPGCFGGFAVVSLYTHKLVSFGALVAMMIASSGDEAFIMLAVIPKTAAILIASLFATGIVAGIIVDKVVKKEVAPFDPQHYQTHDNCCGTQKKDRNPVFGTSLTSNFKHLSRQRALILTGIVLFMAAILIGLLQHSHDQPHEHDSYTLHEEGTRVCIQEEMQKDIHLENNDKEHHNHLNILDERWINILFAALSLLTLLLTAAANEHFIKEHIWNHVVKKHLKSIFLWTFGALLIIHYGIQYLHIEEWIANNMYIMIIIAVLVGLIPESGPHMAFITLFAGGLVPFSVLIANSIVQDGHTTLPLLAESKRSFVKAKAINMLVGLIIGVALQLAGL